MNNLEVIEGIRIENLIHEVRGKQVMLDSDLAKIYKCKNGTKSINLAVKRHIDRFPERFMFKLTEEEYNNLKFQSETSSYNSHGGVRKLPYAFTEQGVAMLSAVLKTGVAESVSVAIMDAFVAMKKFISSNLLEQRFINNMVLDHDERIKLLESNFSNKTFSNEIFYEGQIFDAYYLLLKIFDSSKKSIIIIDNFADKELFKLLSKTNKKVTVYSKNINSELVKKYKKQYDNITLIENDSFHDRFIIIDEENLYHCGSSFKDLGTKCFAINRIDNKELINNLLSSIKYK